MSGLERQYRVEKLDDPEGKHDDCRFFVLDPLHDPLARAVLYSYAGAVRGSNYRLSEDLFDWLNTLPEVTT